MAIYDTSLTVTEITPNAEIKTVTVTTPVPGHALSADTLVISLTGHGISISGMLGIAGWIHSNNNGVVVKEAPATAVSTAGVLTITVGGSTAEGRRTYQIIGSSN